MNAPPPIFSATVFATEPVLPSMTNAPLLIVAELFHVLAPERVNVADPVFVILNVPALLRVIAPANVPLTV